ncbi:hypothetical protein K6025_01030 [Ehrlichia sp. JZT12]
MKSSYDIHSNFTNRAGRIVFYVPNNGILRLGELVPNVTPASYIINPNNYTQKKFLSRVLIHNSRSKGDINQVIQFVQSLGLSPVVYSQNDLGLNNVYSYKENKQYSGSNCVFIISSNSQYETDELYDIIRDTEERFTEVDSEDRSFEVVEYNPASKPLKYKIYDAVFYAEKWSLLTPGEKVLRCCSTILSLAIPIFPPILLLCYLGELELREKAYSANLFTWQYRRYKEPRNIYDILSSFPEEKKREILLKIKKDARKRGFLDLDEDNVYQATNLGKEVSTKNNLLLIESSSQLTKQQFILRITTFLLLTFVCLAKMLALTCHFLKADRVALYCSMLSYCVILIEGLYLVSLKSTVAKVCAAVCMIIASSFLLFNIFALSSGANFGYELIISSVLAIVSGAMLTVALVCNRCYKRDRDLVSKLGGISITSYISMKDHIQDLCKIEDIKLQGCEFESSYGRDITIFNAYKAGVFGDLQYVEDPDIQDDISDDNASSIDSDTISILTLNDYQPDYLLPDTNMEDLEVSRENPSCDLRH